MFIQPPQYGEMNPNGTGLDFTFAKIISFISSPPRNIPSQLPDPVQLGKLSSPLMSPLFLQLSELDKFVSIALVTLENYSISTLPQRLNVTVSTPAFKFDYRHHDG